MGTTAVISINHDNERYAQAAMNAAFAELRRVERLMTRFDVASDIGRANAAAGARRVRVNHETALVLDAALAWAAATNGGFDPAIARVVDLWDVKHKRTPPVERDVQRLAGRQLYRQLDVDASRATPSILVREADAAIDLGGIAAGYGVDRAVAALRDWGITSGFINVGGDIYALGYDPSGEPWQVGIQSPDNSEKLLATVPLADAAIATSGDYEQGYNYRGRRYHHIIDPSRAEPRISTLHTVTVVADRCIDADAASTAVFGLQLDDANRLLALRAPSSRIVSIA